MVALVHSCDTDDSGDGVITLTCTGAGTRNSEGWGLIVDLFTCSMPRPYENESLLLHTYVSAKPGTFVSCRASFHV